MIKLKCINKSFSNTRALTNISLDFSNNGLYIILGPSGSGKSTLLNILGSLEKPTNGKIYFNEVNLEYKDEKILNNYRAVSTAFVFQDSNLIETMNVFENLFLVMDLIKISRKDINIQITKILKELEIEYTRDQMVNSLSSGERQRVALARAILKNSDIILADEPTGNLDSKNSEVVFETLKELSETKLVIVVTHNTELTKKYADTIILMEDSKVISVDNKNVKKDNTDTNRISIINNSPSLIFMTKLALYELKSKKIKYILITLSIILGVLGVILGLSSRKGSGILINEITSNYLESDYYEIKKYKKGYEKIVLGDLVMYDNELDFIIDKFADSKLIKDYGVQLYYPYFGTDELGVLNNVKIIDSSIFFYKQTFKL